MRHGFVQTEHGTWIEASRIVMIHVDDFDEAADLGGLPRHTATVELDLPGTPSHGGSSGVTWVRRDNALVGLGGWETVIERDAAVESFLRKVTFVLNGDGKRER
jgi:hypothetical protein